MESVLLGMAGKMRWGTLGGVNGAGAGGVWLREGALRAGRLASGIVVLMVQAPARNVPGGISRPESWGEVVRSLRPVSYTHII